MSPTCRCRSARRSARPGRQGGAALRSERMEFAGWLKDLEAGVAARRAEAQPPSGRRGDAEAATTRFFHRTRRPPHRLRNPPRLAGSLRRLAGEDLRRRDSPPSTPKPPASTRWRQLVGMSFATVEPGEAAYLPLARTYADAPAQLPLAEVLDKLRPWLNPTHRQARPEPQVRRPHPRQPRHRLRGIAHDTLLESYVLESDKSHDMDSLASRHLGLADLTYAEVCGKGAKQIGFGEVGSPAPPNTPPKTPTSPCACTAPAPAAGQAGGARRALPRHRDAGAGCCSEMERTGVLIDLPARQHSEELGRRLHELGRRPTSPASPSTSARQSSSARSCSASWACRWSKKTATGQPPPDEGAEKLAEDYPLPKLLLEHRSLAKLKNTYTDKLPQMVNPRTGRVHQLQPGGGRHRPLASSEPNLQNIPIRTPRAAASAPPSSPRPATDRLGRLLADRAAHRAHLAATTPACRLRPRRTSTAPPPARIFGVTPWPR